MSSSANLVKSDFSAIVVVSKLSRNNPSFLTIALASSKCFLMPNLCPLIQKCVWASVILVGSFTEYRFQHTPTYGIFSEFDFVFANIQIIVF